MLCTRFQCLHKPYNPIYELCFNDYLNFVTLLCTRFWWEHEPWNCYVLDFDDYMNLVTSYVPGFNEYMNLLTI